MEVKQQNGNVLNYGSIPPKMTEINGYISQGIVPPSIELKLEFY